MPGPRVLGTGGLTATLRGAEGAELSGGAAWTRDKVDITDGIGGTATGRFDRTGWLVGAGFEYAFLGNWSAKVEYDYMQFGSITERLTTAGGLTATDASVKLNTQVIKAGINYRFF